MAREIETPYGHATDAADAVVRYAMNAAVVPLEVAQQARDEYEAMALALQEIVRDPVMPESGIARLAWAALPPFYRPANRPRRQS